MTIKRYDVSREWQNVDESPTGDWCRYKDFEQCQAEYEDALALLQTQISVLKEMVDALSQELGK